MINRESTTKRTSDEKLRYSRYCQHVRNFFQTPKGRELKAQSDHNAKDLNAAIQSGPTAIRALLSAQELWPGDDCACESGIIFWHQRQRYKIGRCINCRDPQRPENVASAKDWVSNPAKEFSYAKH